MTNKNAMLVLTRNEAGVTIMPYITGECSMGMYPVVGTTRLATRLPCARITSTRHVAGRTAATSRIGCGPSRN